MPHPTLFLGHGSPMNAIEENPTTALWQALGERLPRPKAILCISAHWMSHGKALVRTAPDNPKIDDMYGFPKELYDLQYAPKSSPELAQRSLELLGDLGQASNDWGMDHGAWSLLCHLYPKADVPVLMCSVPVDASLSTLLEIGRRLAPLREEGVLLLGSGNVVHNLRLLNWQKENYAEPWALDFDTRIQKAIEENDQASLLACPTWDSYPKAVPSTDHFYPLFVVLGARRPEDRVEVLNQIYQMGSLSMTSYLLQ